MLTMIIGIQASELCFYAFKFMQVYAEENDISIIKIKQHFRFLFFNFDLSEKTFSGHIFIWIILPTQSFK